MKTQQNITKIIKKEQKRQKEVIRLIPSENYTSKAVRKAVGSFLMHKYAEGQPENRYYQGQKHIDQIEKEAKRRAISLFNLNPQKWSVNVQAYSGSIANLAVYNALLEPGDKILSLKLTHGGHLSHAWQTSPDNSISFSGKIYQPLYYTTNLKTGLINYQDLEKIAKKNKPQLIVSGGTAYPREINHKKIAQIAHKNNSLYLADIAHEAGLVATKLNNSPFPYADVVTMTTRKTLRGPIGALIFSKKKYKNSINKAVFPGLQGGSAINNIAGIGIALKEASTKEFRNYTSQMLENAKTLENEFKKHNFNLISDGTDKHLLLIDLKNKKISGKNAATSLEKAGIIVNKNTIPKDKSPQNPSGIRLGTPAVTTRNMKQKEMIQIVSWINQSIINSKNKTKLKQIKQEVKILTSSFPTP